MIFSEKELERLRRHQVGRLATSSKEGVPHVATVCYANDTEHLFLHTGRDTKKGRNIQENPRVAFIVDEYLAWGDFWGVIVEGEAAFHTEGPLHDKGKTLIYEKYPKWEEEYPITEGEPLLVITPTKVISWGLE